MLRRLIIGCVCAYNYALVIKWRECLKVFGFILSDASQIWCTGLSLSMNCEVKGNAVKCFWPHCNISISIKAMSFFYYRKWVYMFAFHLQRSQGRNIVIKPGNRNSTSPNIVPTSVVSRNTHFSGSCPCSQVINKSVPTKFAPVSDTPVRARSISVTGSGSNFMADSSPPDTVAETPV